MAKRKANKNKEEAITIIDVDLEVLDSSDTDTWDLDSPISELFRHEVSKHRSCWRHVFASFIVEKKRITLRDIEELNKRSPCLLEFPCPFHRGERLKRRGKREEVKDTRLKRRGKREEVKEPRPRKGAKLAVSKKKGKLDSHTFECYFENLWKSFSEEKRHSFAYLDCMWFSLYLQPSNKAKVLSWIKKKRIFSKKYVIIPIVCWSHWNLLIFCNFGESLQSETEKPCMLLLDSLEKENLWQYEPDIKKFVLDIFREEGRPEQEDLITRIPLLVPNVPQQRNDVECGNFVLYFINLFMEGAPENFSIEGYPYFMKKDWFSPEDLNCFCQKLHSSAK